MGFRPYQQYYVHLPAEKWWYLWRSKRLYVSFNVFVSVFFLHIDDHSRIILKRNVNSSDYINANYINVSIKKSQICMQAHLFDKEPCFARSIFYFFLSYTGSWWWNTVYSFARYYFLDYVCSNYLQFWRIFERDINQQIIRISICIVIPAIDN